MSRVGSVMAIMLAATLELVMAQPLFAHQDAGSIRPANSPSTLSSARSLMEAERFKDAESSLRAFILAEPRSGQAHYLLAYTLLRENMPKESLNEYTRAAALQTPSAEDLKNVGQAYVLLNDLDDAGKWMSRASEMDPKDADIWYSLGRVRYSEQKYSEAAECFQRTLLLAPRNVKAENNLGLSYEGLNRPDEAIAAYRQAIAWQDASPMRKISEQPLLNLAAALLHEGNAAEAQTLLVRAVEIAPNEPRIHEQMGQLYLQQGNFTEAASHLEAAVRLNPQQSNLHFLLGQAYRHLGRQQEAKEQFDVASHLANPSVAIPSGAPRAD